MPDTETSPKRSPSAAGAMEQGPGQVIELSTEREQKEAQLKELIETALPKELRKLALDLLDSLRNNAGVAERFDAFCVQAFSKPDWAVPASAVIGELFEGDEDRLAELARVPDLVIELGCGQAAVSCIVASKWATRAETHRLARLAECIIAAQGNMKNPAATEVMLALAATLAITRPSRADQLFNAAVPHASEEHVDALNDAKKWLAAGRMTASMAQEARDLWDTRARRPRVAWKWESEDERRALAAMADCIDPDVAAGQVFQRVAPTGWWDLACQKVKQERHFQDQLTRLREKNAGDSSGASAATFNTLSDAPPTAETDARNPAAGFMKRMARQDEDEPYGVRPHASGMARFFLGWSVGIVFMAVTALLAPDAVHRSLLDIRELVGSLFSSAPASPSNLPQAALSPEEQIAHDRAWRADAALRMATKHAEISDLFYLAKRGTLKELQLLLDGHTDKLPYTSEKYVALLSWLHLDPPADAQVRDQVTRKLLDREDVGVITLWERLVYPGSVNAPEIRAIANEVLKLGSKNWSKEDMERLRSIAQEPAAGEGKK
jgi:hypothetical protein